MSGLTDSIKGKIKEVAGKVTGDRKTEVEGKAQQVKGEAKSTAKDAGKRAESTAKDAGKRAESAAESAKKK